MRVLPDDTFEALLELLDHLTPLLDVIAWPAVTLVLAFGLRPQIVALLGRVRHFEFGSNKVVLDQLNPASLKAQREKSMDEAQEASAAVPESKTTPTATPDSGQLRPTRNPLLAEDLALRALQEEYGSAIRRQVTAGGNGVVFDGVFANEDRLYVVEVKYYSNTFSPSRLKLSLFSLANAISELGWRRVRILLVVVFDELSDRTQTVGRLNTLAESVTKIPVIVRTFDMTELQARFDPAQGGG